MGSKTKKNYVCSECGCTSMRWQGQCSECQAWNSLEEIKITSQSNQNFQHNTLKGFTGEVSRMISLEQVDLTQAPRFSSGLYEFNRVLGGGFVPGSVILIGGAPGAGKSTLLLQVVANIAQHNSVLYVSGEESLQQIAQRAKRLGIQPQGINVLAHTECEAVLAYCNQYKPKVVIIDSIQVMRTQYHDGAPGSVGQVRESASLLTQYAKQTNTVMILIGHVTKDHSLAGPMTLSHIIDTQLTLAYTDDTRFRTIRASKNRFGQINELGFFMMTEHGMREVTHPSAIFLSRSIASTPGSVVTVLNEGSRPLLVEIQSLVCESCHPSNVKRLSVGIDGTRINLLLAVLAKHGGVFTTAMDIFINVVSGIKITETVADLPVLLAAVSSLKNKAIDLHAIALGEVGLGGEIRPVSYGIERLKEASKHGFTKAMIPKANVPKKAIDGMKIIAVATLQEALDQLDELLV